MYVYHAWFLHLSDRHIHNCFTHACDLSWMIFISGVGCFGAASIYISQHTPSKVFTVLRLIDLEVLKSSQLEDVQNEMKISQTLNHVNIVRYICSFVVGSKLWAVQPLMHYGKCK